MERQYPPPLQPVTEQRAVLERPWGCISVPRLGYPKSGVPCWQGSRQRRSRKRRHGSDPAAQRPSGSDPAHRCCSRAAPAHPFYGPAPTASPLRPRPSPRAERSTASPEAPLHLHGEESRGEERRGSLRASGTEEGALGRCRWVAWLWRAEPLLATRRRRGSLRASLLVASLRPFHRPFAALPPPLCGPYPVSPHLH